MNTVKNFILIVTRAIGLDDRVIVEPGRLGGLAVHGVELDGIAGLEVGGEIDGIGRTDVNAGLVGELIVTRFDELEAWRIAEDRVEAIIIDHKCRAGARSVEGARVVGIGGSADAVNRLDEGTDRFHVKGKRAAQYSIGSVSVICGNNKVVICTCAIW